MADEIKRRAEDSIGATIPLVWGDETAVATVERQAARIEKAERALVRAGFVDHGGEEWKPPLGKPPRFIEVPAAPVDKLLTIIAHAYQVAGAHDVPDHILNVLADPEEATAEQIDAMLPYVPTAPVVAVVAADLRRDIMNLPCKAEEGWGLIAVHGYKLGHRDARHAAADLVDAALASQAQAAASAPISTARVMELIEEARKIPAWSSTGPVSLTPIQIAFIAGKLANDRLAAQAAVGVASQQEQPADEFARFVAWSERLTKELGGSAMAPRDAWMAAKLEASQQEQQPHISCNAALRAAPEGQLDAEPGVDAALRFAGLVLTTHRNDGEPGDIDGGTLEQFAIDTGLLVKREITLSCGDGCACIENGFDPAECLTLTAVGRAIAANTKQGTP